MLPATDYDDYYEQWCWRKLLTVPWTGRWSNQSILKETSPEYSLEGLVLKLKLQYLGHLMRTTEIIRKYPEAGKDWRRKEKGTTEDEMVGWHHRLNGHEFEQAPGVGDGQGSLVCCSPWVTKSQTRLSEWTTIRTHTHMCIYFNFLSAAATAKSLQSCPTLCDPRDGSPPGSPVPGILQARTLEWVAIAFSNAWKWKGKVKSLSRVRPSATPWTVTHQAPPSMGFSRQEHWSGVPLPSPNFLSRLSFREFLKLQRTLNTAMPTAKLLKVTGLIFLKCNVTS